MFNTRVVAKLHRATDMHDQTCPAELDHKNPTWVEKPQSFFNIKGELQGVAEQLKINLKKE